MPIATATNAKVVDASALAAVLFGEPEGPRMVERLSGARLIAPILHSIELANICVVKCRRHPDQKAGLVAAFQLFGRMRVEELPVDPSKVLDLANERGLTAYDAAYLWLAREWNAELVTLDRVLERHWKDRAS